MTTSRTAVRHEQVRFTGSSGEALVGTLDLPGGPPLATALFAHCFTCSRESHAASRISTQLAELGIAVLRFDFTGLGASEGDFAETTFTSNLGDLEAAAAWLAEHHGGPDLLVGHSLGGAAVIAVAERLPSVKAVAVVGAPASPAHVGHLLEGAEPTDGGHLEVAIGGRLLHVAASLAEDLEEQPQHERIAALKRPLLVLHSPVDEVVGIDEARKVYEAARHPKSFVSLDGADHLLSRAADSQFAAAVIATWATRYLTPVTAAAAGDTPVGNAGEGTAGEGTVVVREQSAEEGFAHVVTASGHSWVLDEPLAVEGGDTGPNPYDSLLAALGACTSMTMRMYARRKGWAYGTTEVTLTHERVHAKDCAECETTAGQVDRIHREIVLDDALSEEQRTALLRIADRCPVHRTLTREVVISTTGR